MSSLEVRGNHDGTTPRHQESPMTTEPTGTTNEADPGMADAVQRVASARRAHAAPLCDGHFGPCCCCGLHSIGSTWGQHVAEEMSRAARSDVPDLVAKVARVEALAASYETAALTTPSDTRHRITFGIFSDALRTVLADPAP